MGKIVLLDFVDGDAESGVTVKLRIETEGDRRWIGNEKGKLPPFPNIYEDYCLWQSSYLDRVVPMRSATRIGGRKPADVQAIIAANEKLKCSVDRWLSSQEMFLILKELLHKLTDKSEEIRFIFQTDNPDLQRLPWHSWHIFNQPYYRKAEAGLYLPVGNPLVAISREKVKVLAVFGKRESVGNETKIKTEKDWGFLTKHLSESSNAELIRLDEPTVEELCDRLDEESYQILFFAGHSSSEKNIANGWIELNQNETITIDNLGPDIGEAVARGLQLAIFNSCDGLGIAQKLAQLGIPNIIVMREPVPDEVAQKFLQRFLEAFAAGIPLYLAVRKAREKINRLENKFPGATNLPVCFQNPAESPLTWRSLGGVEIGKQSNRAAEGSEISQAGTQTEIPWLPTQPGLSEEQQQQPLTIVSPSSENKEYQPLIEEESASGAEGQQRQETSSIICSNCGEQNPAANHFCIRCGAQLKLRSTVNKNSSPPQSPPPSENNEKLFKTEVQSPTTGALPLSTGTERGNPVPAVQTSKGGSSFGQILCNRYRLVRALGRGGFGTTYLAQDLKHPSYLDCVVKQLAIPTAGPGVLPIAKRLFYQEAEVLYKLGNNHDRIPQLLAYFEENGEFYLVQEFIEGHDLSQEIARGKQWSETEAIAFLHEVLTILEFVHQQGVIHRDVKPHNLMRRATDGKLVLIDFGAVKEISARGATRTVAIGTPGYTPSEQMHGFPKINSDIYALGMIAIEAVTGICCLELRENSYTGKIIWRNQAQVSDGLANILEKMVDEYWSKRYQSATEVLYDLENLTNDRTRATSLSARKSTVRPSWIAAVLIALLIGVGIAGLAFTIFGKKDPVPELPSSDSLENEALPLILR